MSGPTLVIDKPSHTGQPEGVHVVVHTLVPPPQAVNVPPDQLKMTC